MLGIDRRNSYRIVPDRYCGYEAQFRLWWLPIWFQCFGVNTRGTLEAAICKAATVSRAYLAFKWVTSRAIIHELSTYNLGFSTCGTCPECARPGLQRSRDFQAASTSDL
jgi:hypothetical protein